MVEARSPSLAVLIDADNASAKIATGLFEEIAKIGEASVRRIYGDFSGTRLKEWSIILSAHAILPLQNFAYTKGKNASDIALVIDAMDLLHSGRFDGFCLVSSDSDFTRLAIRIREQGANVYGFGEQKTPESFRQACHHFYQTEAFSPAALNNEQSKPANPIVPRKPKDATSLIKSAIAELPSVDGWTSFGSVGKQIRKIDPEFKVKTYGGKNLSELVEKNASFALEKQDTGGLYIRLKQKPAAKKSSG